MGADRTGRLRDLFRPLAYNLIIDAVIEGTSPGRIYADDPDLPSRALILSVEGNYLAGRPDVANFGAALTRLLGDTVFGGDTIRPGDDGFSLVFHPEIWRDDLTAIMGGRTPIRSARRHYTCRKPIKSDWRERLPGGFSFHRVDSAFLARPGLGEPWTEHAPGWMATNWGSVEAFLEKSLGFCVLDGDLAVCWCIGDCASGDRCEVGIRTHPDYRKRGLAKATVAGAVEWLLGNGYSQVGWHCSEINEASWRTAEAAGFERVCNYDSYYVLLDR